MFRRHGVVTVEFVKFFGIFEITFDYVPRVAVGGNIHQIKVGNRLGKGSGNFLLATAPTWPFYRGYLRLNM